MKTRVMYCSNCKKDRAFDLVDKDSVLHDTPKLVRGLFAVCTLGTSEFMNGATVTKKWACRHCGEVRRE